MSKPFSNKAFGILMAMEAIAPGCIDMALGKICPICRQPIGEFRDESSLREYNISGMCQTCQDSVFGVPADA